MHSPEETDKDAIEFSPKKIFGWTIGIEASLVLMAFGVAWMFGFYDPQQPISSWFGSGWIGQLAIGAMLSLPILYLVLVVMPRWKSLADFYKFVYAELARIFRGMNVWQVAALSLAAGVGEEILFRWCLQGGLAARFGLGVALAAASLIFGAVHFLNKTYFVLATAMSLILGLIYWRFGLLAAIACHAMYDFLALQHLIKGTAPNIERESL